MMMMCETCERVSEADGGDSRTQIMPIRLDYFFEDEVNVRSVRIGSPSETDQGLNLNFAKADDNLERKGNMGAHALQFLARWGWFMGWAMKQLLTSSTVVCHLRCLACGSCRG